MNRSSHFILLLVTLRAATSIAQTPYPELTLQDASWTTGTHHYAVSQGIAAPGNEALPLDISSAADGDLQSAAVVHLRPGFHAGAFSGEGRFRAHINPALGPPGDVVIISPDPHGNEPYGTITNNVINVHKWEKVEVGLKLPQSYRNAIDLFFQTYYSSDDPYIATPYNVDASHALNPYADDSLRLVAHITKPDGTETYCFGFFMREATWTSNLPTSGLTNNPTHPHADYQIRFRFSPDQIGEWHFRIIADAPYTLNNNDDPLMPLEYTGLNLICTNALDDNKGPIQVNPINNRFLQFTESEEPYFAIGTNLADRKRSHTWYDTSGYQILKHDFDIMRTSLTELHQSGGNFVRMWLLRQLFAPEWVNIGVYDKYKAVLGCSDSDIPTVRGSGQYCSWAFDQILSSARQNNIRIQLCLDPYPPIVAYETDQWNNHAFYRRFLMPDRHQLPENPYDLKNFFYSNVNGIRQYDEGAFYYWKRRYKYIMARWGWSVYVPIVEPINEPDQMLGYYTTNTPNLCPQNRIQWNADPQLPLVFNDWLTDIINYTKSPFNMTYGSHLSPLGMTNKLFLSGVGIYNPSPNYTVPNQNTSLDLGDVHLGFFPNVYYETNSPDGNIHNGWQHAQTARNSFNNKPFNQGEYTHYARVIIPSTIPDDPPVYQVEEIENFFHNYDISFHNELWSSAFSGKFAAGSSWIWARIFWWNKGALNAPPQDIGNPFLHSPFQQFTTNKNGINEIRVGLQDIEIKNKPLHHQFSPLADMLQRPSVMALNFFHDEITPEVVFDPSGSNPLECYYFRKGTEHGIGWVHNRNAWIGNNFYAESGEGKQNFYGCTVPEVMNFSLHGFQADQPYYIYWFPTRLNMTELPPDSNEEDFYTSDSNGNIHIDLNGYFNAYNNSYIDTLKSDYAFVVTSQLFTKSIPHSSENTVDLISDLSFNLYPNPARNGFRVSFKTEEPKDITILDMLGRTILQYQQHASISLDIGARDLAQGTYCVKVRAQGQVQTQKIIIQ